MQLLVTADCVRVVDEETKVRPVFVFACYFSDWSFPYRANNADPTDIRL